MKKIIAMLSVCLACACAQAQWSKLVSRIADAAETATASASQKEAVSALSEQLKGVYKSLAESYTFNDVSAAVDKVKAFDVSGCPAGIQEKYKAMADKLDAFRGSLKNYLDSAKISTDKPIKNILQEVLAANGAAQNATTTAAAANSNAVAAAAAAGAAKAANSADAAVQAASADVAEKSKSFMDSLSEITAAAAAFKLTK